MILLLFSDTFPLKESVSELCIMIIGFRYQSSTRISHLVGLGTLKHTVVISGGSLAMKKHTYFKPVTCGGLSMILESYLAFVKELCVPKKKSQRKPQDISFSAYHLRSLWNH